MTDFSKRSVIKMVALTAVAAAALVGCGKKKRPPRLTLHRPRPSL